MNDEHIFNFIDSAKVATICGVNINNPYCFNCFYSFIRDYPGIVFKSSDSSEHTKILKLNASVAGTIYTCNTPGIDNAGLQFKGEISYNKSYTKNASRFYYRRFPYAALLPGSLCVLLFQELKFTETVNAIRTKRTWINKELH